ncbi:hypothetical protein FRB94_008753 [Tulasnella sp. JGI-2019a]|nr:hypothetical protein FRB94_008753 [Tulasnella sp. JGI-2019a]
MGFQTGIATSITEERAISSAAGFEAANSFDTSDAEAAPRSIVAMLATTIEMPPVQAPRAISTSPPDITPGSSTTSVIGIVGVLTTIALSAITLWQGGQGIRYPRREHQERMKTLVALWKTAEELLKAAEEGSVGAEQIR